MISDVQEVCITAVLFQTMVTTRSLALTSELRCHRSGSCISEVCCSTSLS